MSEHISSQPADETAEISREEILARLGDPSLAVVNVLPREAIEASRIQGSLALPLAEIAAKAREVLLDPGQEIAVYCGSPT